MTPSMPDHSHQGVVRHVVSRSTMPTQATSPGPITDRLKAIDEFFELFEWAYQASIPTDRRRAIKKEILDGWSDPQGPTSDFVSYVCGLRSIIFREGPGLRDRYRDEVVRIFSPLLQRRR